MRTDMEKHNLYPMRHFGTKVSNEIINAVVKKRAYDNII